MVEDLIGYAELIDSAMRNVVRQTLEVVEEEGLPGSHHCYITFYTDHPDVEMSDTLRKQYPEEMTIVLQHQFWDLEVNDDYFCVTLSFNRKKEPLKVPFDALTAFADPSIKFGLQFQRDPNFFAEEDMDALDEDEVVHVEDGTHKLTSASSAEVISLETFRNKE